MNVRIRRLGVAFLVLYSIVFVQLNNVQVFGAKRLQESPVNNRAITRDYGRARGPIVTADDVLLAESVLVEGTDDRYRRVYPTGELFAHVTGYVSLALGSDGVERVYNDELAGRDTRLRFRDLADLFVDRDTTGTVRLTLRNDLQTIARDQLAGRRGSVVAIDPRTGAVLAMYSNPSYDPTPLAASDGAVAEAAAKVLDADPAKPRLARSYREVFFPGSTFKVVTAAAGLESGRVTADEPVYPVTDSYTPPLTNSAIFNFGRTRCGGTLFSIMQVSCNSAFAQMGAEHVGAEAMIERAKAFGFNDTPPFDLPNAAASKFPQDFGKRLQTIDSFYAAREGRPPATAPQPPATTRSPVYVVEDTPRLAQASIGQNDVAATPLQMAMVAAAIANDGVVMKPHVLREILDSDGVRVRSAPNEPWRRALSPASAQLLRDTMQGVVEGGTASSMAIPGLVVGGKTGTAQLGTDQPSSHAWIIGFGGRPGGPAEIAVAVIVEAQPGASEQTGGRVAAPIAQAVIQTALG